MGRKILLITTDQMRHDALGCNGGVVARTPVIDGLARNGINYQRAHNQNVVCMPARATIITGQYVATHGVWMNGVALPEETPTIAHWLAQHGYRTALFGKAHFEPWLGDAAKILREPDGAARRDRTASRLRDGWNWLTTSTRVTRITTCGSSATTRARSTASIR